ncbi:MAG: hypothetical protein KH038_02490 [Eubacterium sp.]|jgi:hypothetical protein|nr:hypothetical protein [Eubacterium sp.]DAV89657.1 MAG TPA: hypothetical protein [Caudoviricetes sp.]
MIEKELKILKEHWKCPKAPSLDGESPICIEMLDTILEKLRKLDDEELVKELSKLSKEDRWYLCPYVIDELAYDDGRKVAEPFIVE